MIADFYNTPIGNMKKLVPNFFDKKSMGFTKNKTKKIHHVLEFNKLPWLKQFDELNTQNRIDAENIVAKIEKRCTN